jgi:predicted membrane protein
MVIERTEGLPMDSQSQQIVTPKLLVGLFITILGLVLLLDELRAIEGERILRYWSLILVAFGVMRLRHGHPVIAIGLIAAGTWILAYNLGWFVFSVFDLWPLLLIGLGGLLVWQGLRGRSEREDVERTATRRLDILSLLTTRVQRVESSDFSGGRVTTLFGGTTLDFTGASLAGGAATIDLFTMGGGTEIIVPEGWVIIADVMPLMGGFEDETGPGPKVPGGEQKLILRGLVLMGGAVVKHRS